LICQQLTKLECLVKARVIRTDRVQHYERTRLDYSEGNEWNEKGLNSKTVKEKKSIYRNRAFEGTVECIYNRREWI